MTILALPNRCDRAAADLLLPDLLAAASSGDFIIDATGVEQIGQAMLQLLVSARMAGATIRPSEALNEMAVMTALDTVLFGEAA